MIRRLFSVASLLLCSISGPALAAELAVAQAEYVVRDFHFSSGEALSELRLHYTTLGTPQRDASGAVSNAVLILHGTTGSGSSFLSDAFAGTLFGPGQILDAARYFIILPDSIGHGRSSKPSDGLRARFPRYDYADMVAAQYRLVTEALGVDHLRLVLGTSMGGMHAWMWAGNYPRFMNAVMPIVCLPAQIAGRNRMVRRMIADAIRGDPLWRNGEYTEPVPAMRTALQISLVYADSARHLYLDAPTQETADRMLEQTVQPRWKQIDANDWLYAWESSRSYDPSPALEKIEAAVTAVNFADDEINPPELGIMERQIARVARGRYVLVPAGDRTRGHRSYYATALWTQYLEELLARSAR
jgi:homoserine O-acetyltransferase/O-succinyltransferase